jgi:uncharacterized membrane protein YhiD involved in acid resistance
MFDSIFVGLFDMITGITVGDFLICVGAALGLGLVLALVYQFRTVCSRSLVITIASLPAVVAVVIMMVGGNLGTGIAVAGTFSMVRFRSMPGSAKEICAVFTAVAVGLACGIGYPSMASVFTVIICLFTLLLTVVNFGGKRNEELRKHLRITLPEDLDYTDVFRDILEEYTTKTRMLSVKTTNLGSLNKLTYEIQLKKAGTEKEMIDKLRCRNGNLEISISCASMDAKDL